MAKIVGDTDNIAGGKAGALQTDFPTSVANVFPNTPKAAMVIEGDFVPGVAGDKNRSKPETGFNIFPFPRSTAPRLGRRRRRPRRDVQGQPGAKAFIEYLTTPEAAEIWAKRGGFSSPNKKVATTVYPDPISETTAGAIGEAETSASTCPTCSRRRSAARSARASSSMFQDFLQNPKDIDGITKQMEAAAAKAYKIDA